MTKTCVVCGAEFEASGNAKTCGLECSWRHRADHARKRKQTPEYKEYNRKSKQTPEYKEYLRKLRQTPEYKEYKRKRKQTPEYKEYNRKQKQTSGYKEYERKRSQMPERKEKNRKRKYERQVSNAVAELFSKIATLNEKAEACLT